MARAPHDKADLASSAVRTTNSKVAVVYTRPETVLEDFAEAMRLADCESFLPKDLATLLKINISWQHYYPAGLPFYFASTAPSGPILKSTW